MDSARKKYVKLAANWPFSNKIETTVHMIMLTVCITVLSLLLALLRLWSFMFAYVATCVTNKDWHISKTRSKIHRCQIKRVWVVNASAYWRLSAAVSDKLTINPNRKPINFPNPNPNTNPKPYFSTLAQIKQIAVIVDRNWKSIYVKLMTQHHVRHSVRRQRR